MNVQIYNSDKNVVFPASKLSSPVSTIKPGEEKIIELETVVKNPQKWSAEKPNLYQFLFTLKESNILVEASSVKFGFREIEIKEWCFS